jgi:hypothetical protein
MLLVEVGALFTIFETFFPLTRVTAAELAAVGGAHRGVIAVDAAADRALGHAQRRAGQPLRPVHRPRGLSLLPKLPGFVKQKKNKKTKKPKTKNQKPKTKNQKPKTNKQTNNQKTCQSIRLL